MNETEKNNTSSSGHGGFNAEAAIYGSFFLIWLPGIVLNIIALVFIAKDIRKAILPAIVLLFMLCVYDLLAVIFSLIQHILDEFMDISQTVCAVSTFLFSYFTISSGILNCLMAIDRVMAICSPFFYKTRIDARTWKISCVVAGVATAVYSTFPIIGLGDIWSKEGSEKKCNLGYQEEPVKRVYGMLYGVVGSIFLLVIVICNAVLVRALFKMKKVVVSAQSSGTSDVSVEPPEMARSTSFEMAFAKMMICLSVAYVVCGTPTRVLNCYV